MERPPAASAVENLNNRMANMAVRQPAALFSHPIRGGLAPGQPLPKVNLDPRAGTPIFISLADGSAFVTGSNIITNGLSNDPNVARNPLATGSATLADLISEIGGEAVIELPNTDVTGKLFWPILQWMDYHFQVPLKEETRQEKYDLNFFNPWDLELFQQYSLDELKQLIIASNYLDVRPLTEYIAKYIAKSIQDLPQEKIAEYLELPIEPEAVEVK